MRARKRNERKKERRRRKTLEANKLGLTITGMSSILLYIVFSFLAQEMKVILNQQEGIQTKCNTVYETVVRILTQSRSSIVVYNSLNKSKKGRLPRRTTKLLIFFFLLSSIIYIARQIFIINKAEKLLENLFILLYGESSLLGNHQH